VATVVLAAPAPLDFSMVSQLSLVRSGIVGEDEFIGDAVYAQGGIIAPTKRFLLIGNPAMIQFQLARTDDEQGSQENILSIPRIAALTNGGFNALGVNFAVFIFPPDGIAFDEWDKRFAVPALTGMPGATGNQPHFGGYISFDFHPFRAKIDIKPGVAQAGGLGIATFPVQSGQQLLAANFNFHHDLPVENRMDDLKECLARWTEVFRLTKGIANYLSHV